MIHTYAIIYSKQILKALSLFINDNSYSYERQHFTGGTLSKLQSEDFTVTATVTITITTTAKR